MIYIDTLHNTSSTRDSARQNAQDASEVNRHMLKQKQRQMAAAKAIKSFWTKRAGDWLVNRNRDEDDETGSLDFSLDYIRETVLRSKFRSVIFAIVVDVHLIHRC